jgi:hypothetical protein
MPATVSMWRSVAPISAGGGDGDDGERDEGLDQGEAGFFSPAHRTC